MIFGDPNLFAICCDPTGNFSPPHWEYAHGIFWILGRPWGDWTDPFLVLTAVHNAKALIADDLSNRSCAIESIPGCDIYRRLMYRNEIVEAFDLDLPSNLHVHFRLGDMFERVYNDSEEGAVIAHSRIDADYLLVLCASANGVNDSFIIPMQSIVRVLNDFIKHFEHYLGDKISRQFFYETAFGSALSGPLEE